MSHVPDILLLPDEVVLEGRPGEAVLDAVRRAGYTHRYGCRRGGCGVCKVVLVEGEIVESAVVAESVLTPEEREQGVRLSCRSVPVTDVVVRLRDDDQLRCVMPWLAGAHQRRT